MTGAGLYRAAGYAAAAVTVLVVLALLALLWWAQRQPEAEPSPDVPAAVGEVEQLGARLVLGRARVELWRDRAAEVQLTSRRWAPGSPARP
jgi:hypothetical protein